MSMLMSNSDLPRTSLAITANKPPVVKYLLENGADPNGNYYLGESPLEWVSSRDPEIARLLRSYGAKDDKIQVNGNE